MRLPSRIRRSLPAGLTLALAAGALYAAALYVAGALCAVAATPGASGEPAAAALEPASTLEAIARDQAVLRLPPLTPRQRLVVGPLDPHLELTRCSAPVEPVVGPGGHPRDRITVELRCAAPRWHLYVPVRVVGTSPALIAAHALVAGTVLSESDFRVEQRDVQELPPGYMDEGSAAVGLTASRPIASGAVITNQMLLGTKVVQRGQTVTLVADAGGLSVRMTGRALSDGLVNQRVRVQNLSSGKIVEGIARSDQVVEIIFQ